MAGGGAASQLWQLIPCSVGEFPCSAWKFPCSVAQGIRIETVYISTGYRVKAGLFWAQGENFPCIFPDWQGNDEYCAGGETDPYR